MILESLSCGDFDFILKILGYIFNLLQWIIPIVLILLITIDVAKAIVGGDEKKTKEATGNIGKRLLYAIILFLIPVLVKFVFRAIDTNTNISGTTSWISCFNEYFN